MKLFTTAALAALLLAPAADEGQWLPRQILEFDWDELRDRGLELTKEQFWDPETGSGVLSAAVQIGGCSASFVSSNGLVLTNHHCGFGAVQQLSTVERNLLRDGFVATTLDEELPAPGMVVYVVRRIRDVTAEIHAAQAGADNDVDRWHRTQEKIRQLVAEGEEEPDTVCHVASFLEGQTYSMYYRTMLTDVRLVYAPPRSVGEFGGEVDNWEWPRHTGDFALFRAYAAPDGSPRPHQDGNVPFQPAHSLKVGVQGVDEGDLVMILGYPGSTERYRTSLAVQDRQTVIYPLRYELFTEIIEVLRAAGHNDERRALSYASLLKSLSNEQKNALGMIEGLQRNGTVAHKLREEEALEAWIAADPARQEKFGGVLAAVLAIDEQERATLQKDVVTSLLRSTALLPLLGTLSGALAAAEADQLDGADASHPVIRALRDPRLTRDWDAVQQPIMAAMLDAARHLPAEQRIVGTEALTSLPEDVATAAWLAEQIEQSAMLDSDARVELFRQGREAVAANTDPLLVLARGLAAEAKAAADRAAQRRGQRLLIGRQWIEAQQAFRGKTFYPDANSTLRVSIASIGGYVPRDGVEHTPHTTVAGVLAKETGNVPFASPAALLEAAKTRHKSAFFDEDLDDVPVCFLSNGDTTGGNSGSPVINGRGELVGLNFDRVFEAVSGDYGWSIERSRNISVDVRYVLWFIESVMPAPSLLAELLDE